MSSPPADDLDPTLDGPPRRSRSTIALIAVAVVLGIGYAVMVFAVSGQDVAAGTTVQGVDVGGMSQSEAVTTLEESLGDEATAPIQVSAGGVYAQIDPVTAGLAVDWEATVEQASGLILNPVTLWRHLRGTVEVEPVTTTDPEALEAALADLAPDVAAEPVEPTITYTKQALAEIVPGMPGAQLDVPGSVDAVSAEYFQQPTRTVDLPMTEVPTAVSEEESQRVYDELAAPAVALPVTLRVVDPTASGAKAAGERVRVDPVDIGRTLTFAVEGSTLAPSLNGKKLHRRLADELEGIETKGRDARIVIRSDKPVVLRSRPGRAVDPDQLAAAVLPVLPGTTADARIAEVVLDVAEADLTTAEAKALNIREKLSSFRQYFPPAEYRYINVGQAAEYLNGTILEPGETFSMNETVKERTPENGYTSGTIISGGRFREELGGGVSIITTATWTAGFYAGLERVEQHPHGLYISRYEAGLEATVAWGLLDLRMRNETGNGVLITAERFSDGVLIEMWGTKKFDRVTSTFTDRTNYTNYETIYDDGDRCVPSAGVQGFSIAVTRRRYVDGQLFSSETWPTTYKPTPNVVCGPEPTG